MRQRSDDGSLRALALNLAKVALSVGLLLYLVYDLRSGDPEVFRQLIAEPKRWSLLFAGWACFLLALGAGLARWQRLAGAVGLTCTPQRVVRIGVLAYMLDFVALGAVGGDLFKALSLRQLHPGRGVHALTTVVADRAIGLGSLLIFASAGAWIVGAATLPGLLPVLARTALLAAALGVAAAIALLALRNHLPALIPLARRIRLLGPHLANLLEAAALYGRNPTAVSQALGLSFVVHLLNAGGFALLASGLSTLAPSLAEHVLIVPLASLTSIVPLPADTLGVLDYAMSYLYEHVTGGATPATLGLLVAMTYRGLGVFLTAMGLLVYFVSRGRSDAPG